MTGARLSMRIFCDIHCMWKLWLSLSWICQRHNLKETCTWSLPRNSFFACDYGHDVVLQITFLAVMSGIRFEINLHQCELLTWLVVMTVYTVILFVGSWLWVLFDALYKSSQGRLICWRCLPWGGGGWRWWWLNSNPGCTCRWSVRERLEELITLPPLADDQIVVLLPAIFETGCYVCTSA